MNTLLAPLLSRMNNLPTNRRVFLSIGIALIIFIAWNNLLWNKLQQSKKNIAMEITSTKTEIDLLTKALETQKQKLATKQKLQSYDQLNEKSEPGSSLENIQHLENYVLSLSDARKVFAAILNSGKDLGLLLKVNNLPEKLIASPTGTDIPIYQNTLVIKFKGDYSSAVAFLKRLEKLPWPLFFDKVEYTVIKYPTAEMTLELHIINSA